MAKSTVYFTNELTPEAVVKMYRQLGIELPGKVAVKVHSGEDGNQNYLHPEFMKPVIDAVNGTVVECNTAYGGARNETPKHIELMKKLIALLCAVCAAAMSLCVACASPLTGDTSNMGLWITLVVVAVIAVVVLLIVGKKKKK